MSEVATLRFACDGCGKDYPWKPELTNKKAKCKCGTVITVPDLSVTNDDPPPLPDDGILDFVESAPALVSSRSASFRAESLHGDSVHSGSFRAAAAIPGVRPVAKAGKAAPILGYRQGPTQRDRTRANKQFDSMHDMKRDVYVPTGLIVGSFLAYFAWLMIHGSATNGASIAIYGGAMAVIFAVKTICMIGGAFIVASLAGVSFGPFWTAILKLAAVAIAPDILASIIEEAIASPGASLVAGSIALAFYWGLVAYLFSMDANEAWIVVVLFGFLRWILQFVAIMVLASLFMSGSSIGSSAMGGNSAPPTATEAAIELSEDVDSWKEDNSLVESLEYMEKTGRQSAMADTVKRLYAAGSRNVWFVVDRDINGKTTPLFLVAEWPTDAKKRAAMLTAIKDSKAARAKAWKEQHPDFPPLTEAPVTDDGGKYVKLPLGG